MYLELVCVGEKMKKSPLVYIFIVVCWICIASILVWKTVDISLGLYNDISVELWKKVVIGVMLYGNCLFLLYFWLNAVKDLMFSIFFIFLNRKIKKIYADYDAECQDKTKKVLLLYCTCNDFNEDALFESSKQDYVNTRVVILDDSSKSDYIERIDNFAKDNKFQVVRRENHSGFKAGNLNNYLQNINPDDYDYIAVLDSDERIPSNFVSKILTYFEKDKNIGAVQAAHVATKGSNVFQSMLGMCVKSNGKICQIMKNFYGSSSLFGHGMMISKECYKKVNGFPEVVAEDISISVKIRDAGFKIVFASNVVCKEEFPTDYLSLKKRQCKWTQGNVEYMKKYNKEITHSKIKWFEKLDLKLSHYSLPIIPILSLFLVINTLTLGFLNCTPYGYGLWFIILLTVFLLSPLIPDIFTYANTKNMWLIIPYFILNMITYASMSPMMISTVVLGIFGKKARFIITPKETKHISFCEIIKASWVSVIFGLGIAAATYFAYHSIVPTLILSLCYALCPIVILLANISTNNTKALERTNNVDNKETASDDGNMQFENQNFDGTSSGA